MSLVAIQAQAALIHQDVILSNVSGDLSAFGLDSTFTGVIGSLDYDPEHADVRGNLSLTDGSTSMQLKLANGFEWDLSNYFYYPDFIAIDKSAPTNITAMALYLLNSKNDYAFVALTSGTLFKTGQSSLSGMISFQARQANDVPEPPMVALILAGLVALRRFRKA